MSTWMQNGTGGLVRPRHKAHSSPAEVGLDHYLNVLVALRCSCKMVPTWLTISGRRHRP